MSSVLGALTDVISIHAPTRGATAHGQPPLFLPPISIHAPTRGATLRREFIWTATPNFNPRSHEGSDKFPFDLFLFNFPISIHAPTRGATFTSLPSLEVLEFQSTLPRGERQFLFFMTVVGYAISIHAPTRGATIRSSLMRRIMTDFNPRSHEGSDIVEDIKNQIKKISIHAPTRGATQ